MANDKYHLFRARRVLTISLQLLSFWIKMDLNYYSFVQTRSFPYCFCCYFGRKCYEMFFDYAIGSKYNLQRAFNFSLNFDENPDAS